MAEDLQRGPPRRSYAQASSSNLADVLERVLDKGIVIAGDIKLFLADVELLTVQIRLVITSVDKAREIGLDWWTNNPAFSPRARTDGAALPAPAAEDPRPGVLPSEREQELERRLGRLEQELGVRPPR
ncbi:MAG TPA: gas vesicle protein [Kofleriaceae bacterium]|jgi:hypothetical protein|nr:gas vesicle protein [Kofleriaceae bacterium]